MAWFVARIGQTLLIGLVLGVALAVTLIVRRRQTGPMPPSGRSAGANAILSIDEPMTSEEDEDRRTQDRNICGAEPARHAL